MTRSLITAALLLSAAAPGFAQDMPLSQILIPGEGWKKVGAPGAKPMPQAESPTAIMLGYYANSPDRSTVYLWMGDFRFIRAYRLGPDNMPQSGTGGAYCQLRGDGQKQGTVTGLVTDRDGRLYAVTELGVQVFDPTGRLCGVLTPAAPGKPEHFAFEGDQLTHWIGDTKYTRTLNTTGAK